jgi:hypothetical protein
LQDRGEALLDSGRRHGVLRVDYCLQDARTPLLPAREGGQRMPCVTYIANGFCREADDADPRFGVSELRIFNPLPTETSVRMTVYYADRDPVSLPEFCIKGEGTPLLVFPKASFNPGDYSEYFGNCGPWGLKMESDTPLLTDHILSAGHKGPEDDVRYRGGCCDKLAQPRLSRLWYFADGIKIRHKDPANAPFPFDEFEWYHVLNPHREEAHVSFEFCRWDGKHENHAFVVPPRHVLMFDNYDWYDSTIGYGFRVKSNVPILPESERIIHAHGSLIEWGAHIHCPRPGVPAPLAWNEEDAV